MADLILIIAIILFAYAGYKRGFIRSLVGMSTTLISMLLSMLLYRPIAVIINDSVMGDSLREFAIEKFVATYGNSVVTEALSEGAAQTFSMIASSVISFVLLSVVVKFIVAILAHSVNLVAKIPVIKQINSVLGIAVGVLSGLIISYLVIGIIATVNYYDDSNNPDAEMNSIEKSYFASMFYEGNLISEILTGTD